MAAHFLLLPHKFLGIFIRQQQSGNSSRRADGDIKLRGDSLVRAVRRDNGIRHGEISAINLAAAMRIRDLNAT